MKNKPTKISLERAYDIIKKPLTTEKSTNLQQFNQYSFVVSKNSNSFEISLFCGFQGHRLPGVPWPYLRKLTGQTILHLAREPWKSSSLRCWGSETLGKFSDSTSQWIDVLGAEAFINLGQRIYLPDR